MRKVHCQRYKQELPGLEAPPFPGPRGQFVFEQVSRQAWEEWLAQQTMLINEKQLNMMDKEARSYLNEQMDRFLRGEATDRAEGYVPPEA